MTEEPKTINPNNIKSLLSSNQSPTKQHSSYDYYVMDDLETEINEFIAYSEIKTDFEAYQSEHEKNFSKWNELSLQDKKLCIQQIMDSLESKHKKENSLKSVVYISLGAYGEQACKSNNRLLEAIQENNRLLFEMDIVPLLKQLLNQSCHTIEMGATTEVVNSACKEVDICFTILYMIIICNKENIALLQEAQMAEFLFELVVRLKEHFTKAFPLKKLMLNIWKTLLFTLGDLNKEYLEMKKEIRKACGLPVNVDKAKSVKCSPEELHAFYNQSASRYPTFIPKKPTEKKVQSSLTASPSKKLVELMGIIEETNKTELPFQTLFPSKNAIPQSSQGPKDDGLNSNSKQNEVNILPLTPSGPNIPHSLSEANRIWINRLYISVSDYQIIHEREKGIFRWQLWKKRHQEEKGNDEWDQMFIDKLQEKQKTKLAYIENLYKSIAPFFQNIAVVLLKLLLSTMFSGKDKESEIMEDVNITRNRETTSKAATSILLLLLKWFKVSHVLKFEYFSQILIDSGCMLLTLKLLGMQEIASLISRKTDDDTQSFFGYVQKLPAVDVEEDPKEEYTNKRNLCYTINLLRILQMLSKKKAQRILLLVQYKSAVIIKKLVKIGHPTAELYALKNLKNQVPFLGRKWRSSNMKAISSIYAQCFTSLNDDWLSIPEGQIDTENAILREKHLRTLIRLYNGRNYIRSLLPCISEISGPDKIYFYSDVNSGLPDYTLNQPIILDDIELDMEFKQNYRSFLDKDVYSTDAEDDDDDDDDDYANEEHQAEAELDSKWSINTPIPDRRSTTSISAEALAAEINKIYQEELKKEFQIKQQLKEKEPEGWDAPNVVAKNTWNDPDVSADEDDESWQDKKPDPLTGIDWNCLTEEDLSNRLTLVEQNTTQRWLNVDMEDPRYLKVLNTCETKIDTDEEGWAIW